jgi:thioesterase DpgC
MILSGRKVVASDPDARALVDVVVDSPDMERALAAAIEQFDSPAVRANRKILNFALYPEQEFRAYMAEVAWQQAVRLHSIDVAAATANA